MVLSLSEPTVHRYKRVNGFDLELCLFPPSTPAVGAVIAFFYGGGWKNGDIQQFRPQAEHYAERGMHAALVEYRVASKHGSTPADSLGDAKSAVRWLRGRADELGFDPGRLIASGGSAGGHLAFCCSLAGFDDPDDDPGVSSRPDALVLFNPVLDTSASGFGSQLFEAVGLALSPFHRVMPGLPPTLVLQGTADGTTPLSTAIRFCESMRAAGNRCELESYPGEGHGFFNHGREGGNSYSATLERADRFLVDIGYPLGAP